MTLRLALRVIRGGGAAGVVRLLLIVVAIGIGVSAAAMVAAMPGVLDSRDAVVGARHPSPPAEHGAGKFLFAHVDEVWGGERLGRMWLAEADADAPPPPGTTRFPSPGEALVSPMLAQRLAADPDLASLIGGSVVGTIAPAGLLGPNELYAYIGVTSDEVPELREGVSWGSPDPYELERQQAGLTEGLALLILPAAVVYLVVCSRLASATRARRYAALRLLGLRRSTLRRVAAIETGVAGLLGGALGLGGFVWIYPVLARSGWLGFTWYPDVAGFGPVLAVLLVAGVTIASAYLGAVGLRRSLNRPLQARAAPVEPRSRWWLLLPMALGFGLLAYPLLVTPPPPEDGRVGVDPRLALVGVVLASGGLLIGMRPLLASAGRLLSGRRLPWTMRIAGRRLAGEPAAMLRLLAGLVLLVLVAGIGAGVMRDLQLVAGVSGSMYMASIDGGSVKDAPTRAALFDLPAAHRWTVQRSLIPEDGSPGAAPGDVAEQIQMVGLQLVTMRCAQLRAVVDEAVPDCADGRSYRLLPAPLVGSPFETPTDLAVSYLAADGAEVTVRTPADALVVADLGPLPGAAHGALLLTQDGPGYGWSEDVQTEVLLPGEPQALEGFKAAVAALSPGTHIQVAGEDIAQIERFRNQRGVLSFGVTVGFLLASLAFAVAAIDRAVHRRRDVAVLVVVGVRARAIRAIQLAQLLAPLALALAMAIAVGHLAGNVALRLNDAHRPWYTGTFSAMVPLALVALAVAAVAGLLVVGRRLRAEDIRRE